jgi:hypothetical protein
VSLRALRDLSVVEDALAVIAVDAAVAAVDENADQCAVRVARKDAENQP